MAMRKVIYDGFTYRSVKEFADIYKIDYPKLMHHVKSGWSIYESIRYQSACTYSELFEGTGYKGVEDFVSKKRLSFPLFMRYFEETLDVARANIATRNHILSYGSDLIDFRGDLYRKILTVCTDYGIKESDVLDRVFSGEELINVLHDMTTGLTSKKIMAGKRLYVNKKTFGSMSKVAEYYDINLNSLLSCVYKGEKVEDAVNKLVKNKTKFMYKGNYYDKLSIVAELVGVTHDQLFKAYKKCGNLDEAVVMSQNTKKKNIKRHKREDGFWNYAGVEFTSGMKMDRAFGLPDGTVSRMVSNYDLTPEEAVDCALDRIENENARRKKINDEKNYWIEQYENNR